MKRHSENLRNGVKGALCLCPIILVRLGLEAFDERENHDKLQWIFVAIDLPLPWGRNGLGWPKSIPCLCWHGFRTQPQRVHCTLGVSAWLRVPSSHLHWLPFGPKHPLKPKTGSQ